MSAYVTANGYAVISGEIALPRSGVWTADLVVDHATAADLSGRVTIALGALSFQGTAFRVGVTLETVMLRVVGGAGGMATVLPAKQYQGVPIRIPVTDALSGAGELLAPDADPGVLGQFLKGWVRMKQQASTALAALLASAGATWRVRANGSVWVGSELWPVTQLGNYDLVRQDQHLGLFEIAADLPSIYPGESFLGQQVSYVEHNVTASRLRTQIWFEDAS